MSITPIEKLSMANKSWEASNQNVAKLQKAATNEQQLNHLYGKELQRNSSKTVKTVKSEMNEFRYDAKEEGNGREYQKNREKKKKNNDAMSTKNKADTHVATSIDIRI